MVFTSKHEYSILNASDSRKLRQFLKLCIDNLLDYFIVFKVKSFKRFILFIDVKQRSDRLSSPSLLRLLCASSNLFGFFFMQNILNKGVDHLNLFNILIVLLRALSKRCLFHLSEILCDFPCHFLGY